MLLKPLIPLKISILYVFYILYVLSESYLNSTISSDDKNLCLDGYKLISANQPKIIKQGGVCTYYRETLPLKTIQLNYLPECLFVKLIMIIRKFSSLIWIDLSVNQSMSMMSFFVVLKV